jgi:hypothetical protein
MASALASAQWGVFTLRVALTSLAISCSHHYDDTSTLRETSQPGSDAATATERQDAGVRHSDDPSDAATVVVLGPADAGNEVVTAKRSDSSTAPPITAATTGNETSVAEPLQTDDSSASQSSSSAGLADGGATPEQIAIGLLSPDCTLQTLNSTAMLCTMSASCTLSSALTEGTTANTSVWVECKYDDEALAACRCVTDRGVTVLDSIDAGLDTACSRAVNLCSQPNVVETHCDPISDEEYDGSCKFTAQCQATVEGADEETWSSEVYCSPEYDGDGLLTGKAQCECSGLNMAMYVQTSGAVTADTCSTVSEHCSALKNEVALLDTCQPGDAWQSSFACGRTWECSGTEDEMTFVQSLRVECEKDEVGSDCTCFYSRLQSSFQIAGEYANLATCDSALDTCMAFRLSSFL